MKGLAALTERLTQEGIPISSPTWAPKTDVTHTLAELGLSDAFPIIVRGDEVARGKPAPHVFIEAARQLGVLPADCLVFEDAPMGIEAAHAAGMRVVALTTSFQASHLEQLTPPPTFVCGDFDEYLGVLKAANSTAASAPGTAARSANRAARCYHSRTPAGGSRLTCRSRTRRPPR